MAIYADAETVEKSLTDISPTLLPRPFRSHQLVSKPDIIVFLKIKPRETSTSPAPEKKKAIFLEISFCNDGFAAARYQRKLAQHTTHKTFLETKGWTVDIIPIIITHSGCITNTLKQSLTDLGISDGQIKKLISKLQRHSCNSNITIIRTFRFLNRKQGPTTNPGIG